MHPLSDLNKLYFHDGCLEQIYYDRDARQLFLTIYLPGEVEELELEFDYGDSLCGLMTFFDVPEESIKCIFDYNDMNHPHSSTGILSGDYLEANIARFELDSMRSGYTYLEFQSAGFTWISHGCRYSL